MLTLEDLKNTRPDLEKDIEEYEGEEEKCNLPPTFLGFCLEHWREMEER